MNTEWHATNEMPRNAPVDQRIQWHIEHAKHCACRPIPPKIREEMRKAVKSQG